MSRRPFKKIRSAVVYENPWIQLEQHEVEVSASGHRFRYTFLHSRPSVMVVALTRDGKIVLIRQYRYPNREFAYELPGGGGATVDPLATARKELREETGYRASRLRKLGEFVVYCGLSDEICHVFLAQGLRKGAQKLEDTEHVTVHEVSYRRLEAMIRRGEFRDGMGLAALRIAKAELERILGPAG